MSIPFYGYCPELCIYVICFSLYLCILVTRINYLESCVEISALIGHISCVIITDLFTLVIGDLPEIELLCDRETEPQTIFIYQIKCVL